jgi:hypothetical protein
MTDELMEYDAVALGELIRKGEISPVSPSACNSRAVLETKPRFSDLLLN